VIGGGALLHCVNRPSNAPAPSPELAGERGLSHLLEWTRQLAAMSVTG
jgi:hypothetical protein